MPILVKMPKWGLMMKAGTVTEWLRAEGEAVRAGEPLFVVETDKTVNDVDAPADGVLRRIVAEAGTEVPVTGAVAVLAAPDEELTDAAVDAFVAAQAPARAAPAAGTGGAPRPTRAARPAAQDDGGRVRASPAARKRARELGVDLAAVTATGADGRVTSDDVERAAAEAGGDDDVREHRVPLPDGSRLHVLAAGPTDAPAVLLLHGIGGSAATWQGVLDALAERHHVLALDLPAHGRSDVPAAGADLSVDALADAALAVLDALGIERATLVGHSLGGAIALAAAHASPRVERLVLVDAAGLGAEISADVAHLLAGAPSLASSRALLELFLEDGGLVLDGGVAEHHAALARAGAHAAIGAMAAAAFDGGTQRAPQLDRLAALERPVLVVWGERDRVVPVAHAEAAGAASAGARVVIVEGAGHAPQLERPDAFAAALARFLEA